MFFFLSNSSPCLLNLFPNPAGPYLNPSKRGPPCIKKDIKNKGEGGYLWNLSGIAPWSLSYSVIYTATFVPTVTNLHVTCPSNPNLFFRCASAMMTMRTTMTITPAHGRRQRISGTVETSTFMSCKRPPIVFSDTVAREFDSWYQLPQILLLSCDTFYLYISNSIFFMSRANYQK